MIGLAWGDIHPIKCFENRYYGLVDSIIAGYSTIPPDIVPLAAVSRLLAERPKSEVVQHFANKDSRLPRMLSERWHLYFIPQYF